MSLPADQIFQQLQDKGHAALAEYLPRQRWFGAKGKHIDRIQIADAAFLTASSSQVLLTIIRVDFNDGSFKNYVLPIALTSSEDNNPDSIFTIPDGQDKIQIIEASADSDMCLTLVEGIREGHTWRGRHGSFCAKPTALAASVLSTPFTHVKRLSGEQSNTSIVFDRRVILKLIRSVDEGVNPDREILEFLTTRTQYRSVPPLIGSIEYEASSVVPSSPDSSPPTVALLQTFVPNEGDGWSDAIRHVKTLVTDRLQSSELNARGMRRLGELTAELHLALSSDATDQAFRPDLISEQDVTAWRMGMTAHIDKLFSQLHSLSPVRQAELRLAPDQLALLKNHCLKALEDLTLLVADPVMKIRVHGDYHLGQVLKTGESFVILDFEGEPARTLQERRAKLCALKDVAGMRRSFHYVGHAARRELNIQTNEAVQVTDAWTRGASDSFWDGYTTVAKPGEVRFLPRTEPSGRRVLRLFELEKTIYEIGYELNNRPDWVDIPLNGLRAMFEAQS